MANKITAITNDISRRKSALKARLNELTIRPDAREGMQIENLADPLDQVRSSTEREMTSLRLEQQTRLIHDIQEALAKLENGDYGLCEQCEEPIAPKRLAAVPWARLCVACQSKAEAQAAESGAEAFHEAA